ncbi:hypothetical protein [Pseudomonas aeruginosa]|uniref:hypothetical protein n=1 Tax=Pseudomonas aeruginosa TaxID=287 RepID=UPI00116038A2|nr:hypothetical protein [Pseudomonas aeruginosa]
MADLYEFAFFVIGAACSLGDLFEVVNMARYLLLLCLSMVSVCAHSEEFYWRISYPDGQVRYKSAEAACQANNDYYKSDYGSGYSRIEVRNKPIDETHWSCYVYAYKVDSKGVEYLAGQRGNNATRYGTECPAGTDMIQLRELQGE